MSGGAVSSDDTDLAGGEDLAAAGDPDASAVPRWAPSTVGRIAAGLIALQIAFRWHSVLRGFFFEDDFPNLYDATTSDLSFEMLFRGVNGHLKPGGYLLIWVLQRLAPMNFGVVAVVLIGLQIAASIMVWRLLKELIGRRAGALVPLSVYLFAPLTLGAFLWYAASIETVLLQLVLAGALLHHVRFIRSGDRRDAWWSVGFVAIGLANWEKALLAVPFVLLFHLIFLEQGGPVRRCSTACRRQWRLWAAHAAVVVVYVAVYLWRVGFGLGGDGTSSAPALAREGIAKGFVPAVMGGWFGSMPGDGTERASSSATFAVPMILFLLLVVVTVVAHRAAWRAWLFLACYLAVDVLLLAGSGRGAVLGAEVGRDVRFFADASMAMVIASAMAFFPIRTDGSPWLPQRVGAVLDRPRVVGAVLALYVLNCAITSFAIVDRWERTSAEPFVRAAQSDLRLLGDVVLIDAPPPDSVLAPWFLEDHRVSRVLVPLPERPRFGVPAERWYDVADNGHLVPAEFQAATSTAEGPDPDCGWKVEQDTPITIPFDRTMYEWNWTTKVAYYAGSAATLAVTVDGHRTDLTVQPGLHDVYLRHDGTAATVSLEVLGGPVCVGRVEIGQMASQIG